MARMRDLPVGHVSRVGTAKRAHPCEQRTRGQMVGTAQTRLYFDRYALDAVPLATDIDGAPGAIVQLAELRVKVESTMDRPVEVRLDVELAVSFRLGM